jgi:hypothetical protein
VQIQARFDHGPSIAGHAPFQTSRAARRPH